MVILIWLIKHVRRHIARRENSAQQKVILVLEHGLVLNRGFKWVGTAAIGAQKAIIVIVHV